VGPDNEIEAGRVREDQELHEVRWAGIRVVGLEDRNDGVDLGLVVMAIACFFRPGANHGDVLTQKRPKVPLHLSLIVAGATENPIRRLDFALNLPVRIPLPISIEEKIGIQWIGLDKERPIVVSEYAVRVAHSRGNPLEGHIRPIIDIPAADAFNFAVAPTFDLRWLGIGSLGAAASNDSQRDQ